MYPTQPDLYSYSVHTSHHAACDQYQSLYVENQTQFQMDNAENICHGIDFDAELSFSEMFCRDMLAKDSTTNYKYNGNGMYDIAKQNTRYGSVNNNGVDSFLYDEDHKIDDVNNTNNLRHSGKGPKVKNKGKANGKDNLLNRLGATVRERTRMHLLNDAFDALRNAVPKHNIEDHHKLSKIATLRMAIQYISTLASTLRESGVEIRKIQELSVGDRRGKRRRTKASRNTLS